MEVQQMLQSKPSHLRYDSLKSKIENGNILIPQFQRSFVWKKADAAKLLDSILKGYPIGSFILWETKSRLRSVKKIGNIDLPTAKPGESVYYVLDGQQRVTSIYVSICGLKVNKDDYSQLYVDLIAAEDQQLIIMDVSNRNPLEYISVNELVTGSLMDIFNKFKDKPELIEKISKYQNSFQTYEFPTIEITDADLDIATDIFTRINITGKGLDIFEIMCAKTYDEQQNFDLYEKREAQLLKWEEAEYSTIPHSSVLQAISVCLNGSCSKKQILNQISKQDFIDIWPKIDDAFDRAIDYLKSALGVKASKLIPYDGLIVPYVYYFYRHPNAPTDMENRYLKDYFWRCSISNRFSDGLESKIAQDCMHVINVILNGKAPVYEQGVEITADFIERNGSFSMGNAMIKGLLCLLVSRTPKSFKNNNTLVIDNDWLSQSNSKNYHHFFPRAYMKKVQPMIPENMVNHIANITIVDSYLNKGEIKDKAPEVYMGVYYDSNPEIINTMKTHLIGDLDEFGVWDNNYPIFFKKRIEMIVNTLKSEMMLTDKDIIDED